MSGLASLRTRLARVERRVWLVLLLALAIRVAVGIAQPLADLSDDAELYVGLAQDVVFEGYPFLTIPPGPFNSVPYHYTSVGPAYPAFLIPFFAALPGDAALVGVRVVQILLDLLTVWLVYRIGTRLFGPTAGFLAMAAMALDVRFALQASDPSTETLYTLLLVAGFALYLAACRSRKMRHFAGAGTLLSIATLTRPVPLLLPLALAVGALLAKENRARLLAGTGVTALALWVVVTPWIIRNAVVTGGQFIPVTNTGASTFWLGATGDGGYHGHEAFLEERAEDFVNDTDFNQTPSAEYVGSGLARILDNPLAYLAIRARNTLAAYLQPYGTVFFAGPSIKQTAADWLRGQATLKDVISTAGFWPKLVMYVLHYAAVGLGLAGLGLSWRRWREVLPLALVLAYGTAVYAFLLIIPRYLFPLTPFYWIAAGFALLWLSGRIRRTHSQPARSNAR